MDKLYNLLHKMQSLLEEFNAVIAYKQAHHQTFFLKMDKSYTALLLGKQTLQNSIDEVKSKINNPAMPRNMKP